MPTKRRRRGSADDDGVEDYGTQWYWEQRYSSSADPSSLDQRASEQTSEWLFAWSDLKPLFRSVPRDASIIDVGSGNSDLCFELADQFDGRIVAIDNAPTAIDLLRKERARRPGPNASRVELEVVDALKLHTVYGKDGTFDVAVDKSTLDAMFCDPTNGHANVYKMYRSISSVLRPTATVFLVSWRQPQDGLDWLAETVLPALVEGCPRPGCRYAVDIHAVMTPEQAQRHHPAPPPIVYEIRRRECRLMLRPSRMRTNGAASDVSFRYRVHG